MRYACEAGFSAPNNESPGWNPRNGQPDPELVRRKETLRRHYDALAGVFDQLQPARAIRTLNIDQLEVKRDRLETHFGRAESLHFLLPVSVVGNAEYARMEMRFEDTMARVKGRIKVLQVREAQRDAVITNAAASLVARAERGSKHSRQHLGGHRHGATRWGPHHLCQKGNSCEGQHRLAHV